MDDDTRDRGLSGAAAVLTTAYTIRDEIDPIFLGMLRAGGLSLAASAGYTFPEVEERCVALLARAHGLVADASSLIESFHAKIPHRSMEAYATKDADWWCAMVISLLRRYAVDQEKHKELVMAACAEAIAAGKGAGATSKRIRECLNCLGWSLEAL